jgi:hypothetical protein
VYIYIYRSPPFFLSLSLSLSSPQRRTFSDAGYFNEGVTINICAMQNDKNDGTNYKVMIKKCIIQLVLNPIK